MTATGPEQGNTGEKKGNGNGIDALRQEVMRESREQLMEQLRRISRLARDVKTDVEIQLEQGKPADLGGDPNNKESPKGKATTVKQAVQKALIAATIPEKTPSPVNKPPEVTTFASTILQRLSENINPETDISDQGAPYLYQIIYKTMNGELSSVEDLATELSNVQLLRGASSGLYDKVQKTFFDIATKDKNISVEEAKRKFGVDESQTAEKPGRIMRGSFEDDWRQHYSSYFNEEDRTFVASLYSADGFTRYVDGLKAQLANGRDVNSVEVCKAASKEIERKTVELFGKLYTRLDHEKPSEFFHEIEQQDIMRGILPVKNELKRRMIQLAFDLEQGAHEGSLEELGLFKSVERRADVVDVQMGKDKVKPRYRLSPYTEPQQTSGGEFIHYLDQIVDHYIEARKYTHNARAIFLHPVDPEKGFYSQLSQFANDMSTVDFDQIMALPDNEVFRDAFSMYDKMVDETFASNDWRHFPTMFQLKQNSLHTQVEEDVLDKLKIMYAPQIKSGEMTMARLEASLSMAVGASRGMFLNEIEKAAFADPHLDENGNATFASYYNQDNSALTAFNPMHHHYRWQTTNTIDPILFMPVEGFKGDKIFSDHTELWQKMQAYKDSFANGRKSTGIEGETLWADFLVNIGKVGGPMQRKGWRTKYMLEPLYVRKEGDKGLTYDYKKTWMRLENIGYDVMTDMVDKIPFLGEYKGRPGGKSEALQQKNELFTYMYEKYFDGAGGGLDSYLSSIRSAAEDKILGQVRSHAINPGDIRGQIETETSNQFLYRTFARMIAQRIPSKILRIDRDRHSKDGVGRWRLIAKEMNLSTKDFDDVMKNLLTAEQLLRKDVSAQMRQQLAVDNGKEPWNLGNIAYSLTADRIDQLLSGKLPPEKIAQTKELLQHIEKAYTKNTGFLDGQFAGYLRNGEYKFSFALDELDMSFIPWRGAGARVLPRAVGDISNIEKNVAGEVTKLPKLLQQIAIDGKHDFSPVIELMSKVYGSLDGIIGTDYAHRVVHHIAALTINYFKKDTRARVAMGVFGLGRKNSIAAERAGRGTAVWEWDSRQIDNFCTALETRALLPLKPYNPNNTKPEYVPTYINIPGLRPIKLPTKFLGKDIRIFTKRKPDFEWSIKNLRDQFGSNWKDKMFDMMNTYLPLVIAWLLWKYMQEALKESEGKKK